MGITAITGPHLVFGLTRTSSGLVGEYNEERGPSLYDLGYGVADPRPEFAYMPGSAVGTRVFGFANNVAQVDVVASSASSNALATNQAPVANTALTLTAGSGVTATTIIAPETGQTTGTLYCIGSTAQYLPYGDSDTVVFWNPAAMAARCISITTSSSGDGGSWSIAGRDIYGFKMTENLSVTGSSATVTSRKAFKFISGITASTTVTSTGIIVGYGDVFGLPLLCTTTGANLEIKLTPTASLQYALSSGPVTLGSTATQTATSSDPRGTYSSTTATNSAMRLQITQVISPSMTNAITATDVTAMFGGTQFSSV